MQQQQQQQQSHFTLSFSSNCFKLNKYDDVNIDDGDYDAISGMGDCKLL